MDVLSSKNKLKKKKKKARQLAIDSERFKDSHLGPIDDVSPSEHSRQYMASMHSESESDYDADLTYEQYLKEVKVA